MYKSEFVICTNNEKCFYLMFLYSFIYEVTVSSNYVQVPFYNVNVLLKFFSFSSFLDGNIFYAYVFQNVSSKDS